MACNKTTRLIYCRLLGGVAALGLGGIGGFFGGGGRLGGGLAFGLDVLVPLLGEAAGVLAVGIAAAGDEAAATAVADPERLAALLAVFLPVLRDLQPLVAAREGFGAAAVGVPCAGQEPAQPARLDHHRRLALVALLALGLLRRKRLGVLALRESGAAQEPAVLVPPDHHGLAALRADLARSLLALFALHLLFGLVEEL